MQMIGWFTILKTVLGIGGKIFGKFKQQKYVEKVNEIKRLNFKYVGEQDELEINGETRTYETYLLSA